MSAIFLVTNCRSQIFSIIVATAGGTDVDLFFVLSGFLITRLLIAARGKPDFLKNFYARRVLRIFPLYYGFLFFQYLLVPLLHLAPLAPFKKQIWAWTYMQNVGGTFFDINASNVWEWTPHFWSLAVEEHFYLVWPFIVKWADPGSLPFVLLGTVPVSILSRGLLLWSGHGVSILTPSRVDALGLGSLLAIIEQKPQLFSSAARWARVAFLLLIRAVAASMFFFGGAALPLTQLLKDTLMAVTCAALLLIVLNAPRGGTLYSFLTHQGITTIGKCSGPEGETVFH